MTPSVKSISLRLPIDLLEQTKITANKRDVPYQSLIKVCYPKKSTPRDGVVRGGVNANCAWPG
jgi:predicted DNA binding CopG/RHH family protein